MMFHVLCLFELWDLALLCASITNTDEKDAVDDCMEMTLSCCESSTGLTPAVPDTQTQDAGADDCMETPLSRCEKQIWDKASCA
jgi:hypothetical protein